MSPRPAHYKRFSIHSEANFGAHRARWGGLAKPGNPARFMSERFFVGLDVGGTTMKAGVVDDAGHPLAAVSLPTEAYRGQEFGLERMCEAIRQAVAAANLRPEQLAAIGVATPGL